MSQPEPLAGRYRFVRTLRSTKAPCWLAVDETNGSEVIASALPAARAGGLAPLVGFSHRHACTVLDVLQNVEPSELPAPAPPKATAVAVASHVAGRSLHQRIETAPVEPDRAVRWIIRLADALAGMHARGGYHGAVSPRSVIVSRVSEGQAPLLTHLMAPPSGAFCSPERVTGGGPSAEDDVWALAATLYATLARRSPFHGASRTELARAIVAASPEPLSVDNELEAIIRRGLGRKPADRPSVENFRDELSGWLSQRSAVSDDRLDTSPPPGLIVDRPSTTDDSMIRTAFADPESEDARRPTSEPPAPAPAAGDDAAQSDAPADADAAGGPADADTAEGPADADAALRPAKSPNLGSSKAPNLGSSTAPTEAARASRSSSSRKTSWVLGVVAVLGVAGLAAFFASREPEPEDRNGPAARAPAPKASAASASSASPSSAHAPASPASKQADTPEPSATPTAAQPGPTPAPDETPGECVARLLPEGTFAETPQAPYLCEEANMWLIGRRLYSQITNDGKGDGMVAWVHLGRRELPVLAFLRNRCCEDPLALEVAVPDTACGPLVGRVQSAARSLQGEAMDEYLSAIDCLIGRQVHYPERWSRVSAEKSKQYFAELVRHLKRQPPPE